MRKNNQLVASGVVRTTKTVTNPETNETVEVSTLKDYNIYGGHVWAGMRLEVRDDKQVTNPKNGNTWFPWIANFKVKTMNETVAMQLATLDKKPATVSGYLATENVTPEAKDATFVQFFYVTEVQTEEAPEVF